MPPQKLVFVGLDAALPRKIKQWAAAGKLPHLARLIERGVFAELWPAMPPNTGNNWACLATGAFPRVHGATGNQFRVVGEPPDRIHDAFVSTAHLAEHLWDAAERIGKRSILMKYPATWPPTIRDGWVVDGHSVAWRATNLHLISPSRCFTTESYPLSEIVALEHADEAAAGATASALPPLHTTLSFRGQRSTHRGYRSFVMEHAERRYEVLLTAATDRTYDQATITRAGEARVPVATTGLGEWSEWVTETFDTPTGAREGTFRFKLMAASSEPRGFRLYCSEVYPTAGFTHPEELGAELHAAIGPFIAHPDWQEESLGWVDEETALTSSEYQMDWLARATCYLMERQPWDLFFTQSHVPDWLEHSYGGYFLDPDYATAHPQEAAKYEALVLRGYQACDRMLGAIVAQAGEDALVVVASDHGQIAIHSMVHVNNLLHQRGLIALHTDPDTGQLAIDWSRTRAHLSTGFIYVNLKGRDPQGIVAPDDYEQVCDEVIDVLHDIRDPVTGKRPITMVLRRADAAILGLGTDRMGDLYVVSAPGYWAEGFQLLLQAQRSDAAPIVEPLGPDRARSTHVGLPTYSRGDGTVAGVLIMAGPGIKQGAEVRHVWTPDVPVTIAHAMELPLPRQAEGRVIYQALQDPDAHINELRELRRERDQLRRALETMQQAVTHY